jgi:Rad52/22 family double-strand break repair protein
MTNEEKKKLYAALSAPFLEEAIERTDGRVTGRGYSTTGIKYQYVVNRLNEVLGIGCYRAHRTVTVKEMQTAKGRPAFEAICDLTLELGTWENGEFVCWAESLADGGHTSMSEADARKGAYTNAFKKAAAFFGVGKQAYEGSIDDDNTPPEATGEDIVRIPPPQQPQAPQRQEPVPSASLPASQPQQPLATRPSLIPAAPARNRLTSKQLAALWAMARKLGLDQSQFRQAIKQREGVQPEFLSRDAASRLISEMSARLGNGHADGMGAIERQPGQEG